MFLLTNLILFCKYRQILILMAATHSKKVGTEACLGIEDTNSFASKIFDQSRLIQDFRCSAVCDCCCLILLFTMSHTFSIGDRSGLQVGHSNTFTLSLRNHAVVARAEWELASSSYNNHGRPMKDVILMAVYVSVQSQYMPPCHYLRTYASHPCCLLCCTHIPWQTSAFASVANECLDGLFGLWNWELDIIFLRNTLKCGLILPQHTFSLSFWLSEMSSGPENPAASLHRIDV